MCGIVGVFGHEHVVKDLYDGLITLQHRGQDAAGIVTYDGKFRMRKALGLVNDIFDEKHLARLKGYAGLGHNRYATAGSGSPEEAQPFLGQSPFGVVLIHNGNVFNAGELRKEIYEMDHRLVNSDSDSEVVLHVFTKALSRQVTDRLALGEDLSPDHIWSAVKNVFDRAKGSYSIITYIAGQGMVAFRDPHGIRPLIMGKRENGVTTDYIFASESVTLDVLGYKFVKDVEAGEVVFIDERTRTVHTKVIDQKAHIPCSFEYIYFARPDSMLDNVSVYKARIRMGENLAKKIRDSGLPVDVIIPVPDSARTAALALSEKLNIRYREGLVKNRYIGRTFIMPGQKERKQSIRYKLNAMPLEIKGKNVLLVDDSIVRGNTSRRIVEMVKEAGAKKVYLASYSPPVVSPCLYGIDIPTYQELIAANNTVEGVCKYIGADALFYEDIKDALESCIKGNPKLSDMCMACFDGVYKTGDVDESVLSQNSDNRLSDKGSCEVFEDEVELAEIEETEGKADGQLNLV